MAKLNAPKIVKELLQELNIYDQTHIWQHKQSKQYIIKHMALEKIATHKKIVFDMPQIIEADSKNEIAVVCVKGKMGNAEEWSIGEASPKNNFNPYCFAMAEKRAKDRVILKLIGLHGEVYSSAEMMEEEPKEQPKEEPKDTSKSSKLDDLAKEDNKVIELIKSKLPKVILKIDGKLSKDDASKWSALVKQHIADANNFVTLTEIANEVNEVWNDNDDVQVIQNLCQKIFSDGILPRAHELQVRLELDKYKNLLKK